MPRFSTDSGRRRGEGEMPGYLGFALALMGNAILSLGMALQKANIAFVGYKGPRDGAHRRRRLGWIAGLILMNLAPIFNYLALSGIPPNLVAATAGANVAFTALLSAFLLGERMGRRAVAASILLIGAICFVGLRGGAPAGSGSGLLAL